ncbi:MAG: asparaginase [Salibacteraceae bacterium]
MQQLSKVLIIYTGGTIGMVQDIDSNALHPFDFSQISQEIPELNKLDAEIDTIAFDVPFDSSDVGTKEWNKIAQAIGERYNLYDGFIVLHGTDTMAYTASALSFMLEGLNKPVILTGSQLPIGVLRTDGKENLLTAIEIAADKYEDGRARVGEVAIYFEYKLIRGNRAHKTSTTHFDAFNSPNFRILAEAGVNIEYKNHHLPPFGNGDLNVVELKDQGIFVLPVFPGMSKEQAEPILKSHNNWAVLLITFGAGNVPMLPWFLKSIKLAIQKKKVIVNITQCSKGKVNMSLYKNGRILQDIGVIGGSDITTEAALTKLMYLKEKCSSMEDLKKQFETSLRGEMTL